MKKLSILTLTCVLAFSNVAMASKPVGMNLDNKPIKTDVEIYAKNNRTLVPIRVISESLGYNVEWNSQNNTVKISNADKNILLKINSDEAFVNSKKITIDVPAEAKKNRTFVPIRFVAENMGVKVEWDQENYTVNLFSDKKTSTENTPEAIYKEKIISISKEMNIQTETIKNLYFKDASKYTTSEKKSAYDVAQAKTSILSNQIKTLDAPEKFKQTHSLVLKSLDIREKLLSKYHEALVDANKDAATELIKLQTELAIVVEEITKCMEAESNNLPYVPSKDIQAYHDSANPFGDETLGNLFKKI